MPTLEDDIAALRSYIGAEEGDGRPWAHDAVAALDRLAKATEDLLDLEACAKLIASLDENGPARGNRERVKLLADWRRARKRGEPVVESTP